MGANITQPTGASVQEFLESAQPAQRREDGLRLAQIMSEVTGVEPQMWGPSIVGYGQRHYRYASGHEGDWMRVGFSPRKAQLSLYGLQDHPESAAALESLGPHTTGAGCVYIKKLDAVDEDVLRTLIALGFSVGDQIAERN